MSRKWAYEYTDEELVEALIRAAAEAGFSNSGLVISPASGIHRERLNYLKGVTVARLEGESPPIKPVSVVTLKDRHSSGAENFRSPDAEKNKEYTVRRVCYKRSKWYLSFVEGDRDAKYPYENFEVVEKVAV